MKFEAKQIREVFGRDLIELFSVHRFEHPSYPLPDRLIDCAMLDPFVVAPWSASFRGENEELTNLWVVLDSQPHNSREGRFVVLNPCCDMRFRQYGIATKPRGNVHGRATAVSYSLDRAVTTVGIPGVSLDQLS